MTGMRKTGKAGGTKGPGKRNAAGTRPARPAAAARARTTDARTESEEKYKFLIDATNTGYVILDDRGRVLDANHEYVRMTGRGKLADILGKPVTDWTASYDLERNAAEVRACMETGSVRNLVIDYVDGKGKAVPIEINATVLPGPPARIFTVCRDITDRKRADQEIAGRETLLRQIMDTASVAIFLVDKSGRITHANRRMAEMFGCPMEELIGSEYVAHVHPSEREIGRKRMLALLASESQSVDLERLYWRKDGTEFWGHLAGRRFHDMHGTEIGLIGVITDIDPRKRAEESLHQSEEKFRLLVETSYDWIWEVDAKGVYTYTSPRVRDLLGYEPQEIVGKTPFDLMPPDERERVTDLFREIVRRREPLVRLENANLHKDGRRIVLETSGLPVFDAGGTFQGYRGVDRDITDRRRAEEALRQSEQMLKTIVDTGPDCIKVTDRESRIIMMNRAGLAMVQADSLDEVKGRVICPLVAPEHRAAFLAMTDKVFQGGAGTLEFQITGMKGRQMWLETYAVPLRNEKNEITALLGVTRDISDRKHAEESLRESENWTRSIVESIPIGMHMYRLGPDGRLVLTGANPAANRILGVDNNRFIGKTIEEAFPPLAETEVPQRYRDVVTTGQSWQTESIEYRDSAITGAFEVHAFRTGPDTMVAAFEMITERKRAEMAVRESEAKFRRLYNETPVMLHSIDRDAVVVDVNEHWLKVMGYAREEVLGRNVTDFYTPASTKYAREVVQPAFFRDGVVKDVAYQFIRKNGEVIDVLLSASAERDAEGRVIRSQAVIQDITERKHMEDLLRQSETTYRGILDSMKEAVYIQDETGSFIDVNKGAELMYGFSRDEFVGGSPAMVSAEGRNDLGRVMDQFQRALSGIPQAFEFWGKGKDGRIFPKEVHLYPGRYFGRTVVIAIAQDITERKRTEDALKESEERFKAITMTASDAILLMDDRGKIVHWNPAAERMFGYSEREAIGKDLHLFLGPKRMHDDFRRGFGNFVRTGQGPVINKAVELVAAKKDGAEFPIEVSTSAMNIAGHWHSLGIVRDITERKRAEDALRQSEERFRDLAESLPLTVFEMDLQGRFTYVNRAALEKFGYSRQEFDAGLNMAQMIAPGDRDRAREIMASRLTGNTDGYQEYQGLRKDGTAFPVTVASGPILRDGRPVGLRGIVSDLSERKQLEEELMKSQKLESLGTLAGGIAHDFNNLLQAVFGYISMAKLTHDQREKSLAMLEQAEKALHQSVNLTSQLLTFSKGGKPLKKVIDLRPVIENSVKFALSGSRSTAELQFADDLRLADADAGQIGQVVQNLVLNADQAMPEGGVVRITAGNAPASGLPHGLAAGNHVVISIGDSGVGIPAQHLKKIFDPYFTTKEKGSGLGLATSYSIVKNHGGALEVASEIGNGSTFTVYLPASEQKVAAAAASGPAPLSCALTCRVLVMDDEEMVRKVTYQLLQRLGHGVELAGHGEEAIGKYRQAKAEGRPFDVVILDLTIRGGMGGAETMRKLREIDPAVKAIVSSGYSDDDVVANYREHGFAGFLKKPYDLTGLQTTLNELLR